MSKKEKAAQVLQHPDGGGQQTVLPGFELSESDFTMQAEKNQAAIAGLLLTGAENAITLTQLSRISWRDARTVRLLIQRDRAAGFPVCVDNVHGYYLPATEEEKSACVRSMRHRAREVQRTADNIERGRVL